MAANIQSFYASVKTKGPKFLKHADAAMLGAPTALFTIGGVAFARLEKKQHVVPHQVGWFGCRMMILLAIASGLPLFVYLLAKATFAKILNGITSEKSLRLRNFSQFSQRELTVIPSGIFMLWVITPDLPSILKGAKKAKDLFQAITIIKVNLEEHRQALQSMRIGVRFRRD